MSRIRKQSSGLFSRRTPEQACEGRETGGCSIGHRLTAGWALLCWFWALYGATSPDDVLLEMLQKRLPEGAVRRCPAALARLDSGRGEWCAEAKPTSPKPMLVFNSWGV